MLFLFARIAVNVVFITCFGGLISLEMRSVCCVYAVCLCRGRVNAVGCHFVEKHYGLGLHRMGWAGLGLGWAGLQVSDWVAAESSRALRPRPASCGWVFSSLRETGHRSRVTGRAPPRGGGHPPGPTTRGYVGPQGPSSRHLMRGLMGGCVLTLRVQATLP